MQASYTFRRSPTTLFASLTIVIGALIFGGVAGYTVRAIGEPSITSVRTQALVRQSTWPPGSALYEQGGRPAVVYSDSLNGSGRGNAPANVYEQGGRPPVVYTTP